MGAGAARVGAGPVTAAAILKFRDENGGVSSVDFLSSHSDPGDDGRWVFRVWTCEAPFNFVEQPWSIEDGREVYGPMSLHPPE